MIRFSIFIIVFYLIGNSYAQEGSDYYTEIAGDSTLNSGKNIYTRDIGDIVKLFVYKGLNRIVFSKSIIINDETSIQLLDSTGRNIEFSNHETYIDFQSDSFEDICLIMKTDQLIEEEVIGKLFYMYNINFKGDAPDFTLTDIYGNVYTNENLLGKIVVFNFWGIWCKPCVKEIPKLNKLSNFYSNRDDIIFLAVSSDPEKSLKKFTRRKKFRYNQISFKGANELSRDLMDLGMYGVPVHIVLDKRGNVVFRFLGDHPEIANMLTKSIERKL